MYEPFSSHPTPVMSKSDRLGSLALVMQTV